MKRRNSSLEGLRILEVIIFLILFDMLRNIAPSVFGVIRMYR